MKEMKICIVCGKPFYGNPADKMCSDECRAIRNRQKAVENKRLRRITNTPNAEILEISKRGIDYGKMVAEREYKVTVDKVFEDNMDELRFEK